MSTTTTAASCVVVGAGHRGGVYSSYALDFPGKLKVVAVCEPRDIPRSTMQSKHNIAASRCFESWKDILHLGKIADFVIITTQDQLHMAPAVAFANLGYHILLEKPMAVTADDCIAIAGACDEHNVLLCVCHVLRYSPVNKKIKELISSGAIGDIISLTHKEPVGYWHFSHSFVRGNWATEKTSAPALLAKSCHDLDLIRYWMSGECTAISSFGSLAHFSPKKKPPTAADRCSSCPLQDTCPYSATTIYLKAARQGATGWPLSALVDSTPDIENIGEAIRTGPYGRCVYACENDVVDNQVVSMEFDHERTATFSMIAFTEKLCVRQTQIHGSLGEITCDNEKSVTLFDFKAGTRTVFDCTPDIKGTRMGGHGGSDFYLMDAFVQAIRTGDHSLVRIAGTHATLVHCLCLTPKRQESRALWCSEGGQNTRNLLHEFI
eukprot:m.86088 g.86088  ORF g.86088 m.86088 type:complete len:436 (-) comp16372_c0_seq11:2459-3766(-)